MTHIFELLEGGSISDCLFLPAFWLGNLGVSSIAIEERFKLLHRMSHNVQPLFSAGKRTRLGIALHSDLT